MKRLFQTKAEIKTQQKHKQNISTNNIQSKHIKDKIRYAKIKNKEQTDNIYQQTKNKITHVMKIQP